VDSSSDLYVLSTMLISAEVRPNGNETQCEISHTVGAVLGVPVGSADGEELGCVITLGVLLGSTDGVLLGEALGCADGSADGWAVGVLLGSGDGNCDGCADGDADGSGDGCTLGDADGHGHDGCAVGDVLGCSSKHCTNVPLSTTVEFASWASSLATIAALFEFA
jgi:hypothetical protein